MALNVTDIASFDIHHHSHLNYSSDSLSNLKNFHIHSYLIINFVKIDFHTKFLIRYGNMVVLFNAGPKLKVEDIEDLVYTKWSKLIGHKFKLSCLFGDVGEIFLGEDSKLGSVVSICQD